MNVFKKPLGVFVLALVPGLGCASESVRSPARMRFEMAQLPSVPRAVGGAFSGVLGDTLVVAGGTYFPQPPPAAKVWVDEIVMLPARGNAWIEAGRLERPLAYGAAISTPRGLVLAGGCDARRHYDSVHLLTLGLEDHAAGHRSGVQIANLPPLPRPAAYLGGARLGSQVFVAGGCLQPNAPEALRTFWVLDLQKSQDGWRELEPWRGPGRILPVVVAQDGAVHVCSGAELVRGADGQPVRRYLTDAHRYRPGSGWERIADLPYAVAAASAVAYGTSQILVFGGDDGSLAQHGASMGEAHPGFRRTVLAYDTIGQVWTLSEDLFPLPVTTGASWLGDAIVIPTGEDRPGHRTDKVYALKPAMARPQL